MKPYKEPKPKILWSVDYDGVRSDSDQKYPLYQICKDTNTFIVLYHGCCNIYRSSTFEDSVKYVERKLAEIEEMLNNTPRRRKKPD